MFGLALHHPTTSLPGLHGTGEMAENDRASSPAEMGQKFPVSAAAALRGDRGKAWQQTCASLGVWAGGDTRQQLRTRIRTVGDRSSDFAHIKLLGKKKLAAEAYSRYKADP